MEYHVVPYNLEIKDSETGNCPCCCMVLHREVRMLKYQIWECSYCRYQDRPFVYCSNAAEKLYGKCSCEYGEKEFMCITCEICRCPTCVTCGNKKKCSNNNCSIPTQCFECTKKQDRQDCHTVKKQTCSPEFKTKWKNSTPQEKLNFYGTAKLKILAKNKGVKGYSKHNKSELIKILSHIVGNEDFPIKN